MVKISELQITVLSPEARSFLKSPFKFKKKRDLKKLRGEHYDF